MINIFQGLWAYRILEPKVACISYLCLCHRGSQINKYLLSHIMEGQALESGLAGWSWLKVSHEVQSSCNHLKDDFQAHPHGCFLKGVGLRLEFLIASASPKGCIGRGISLPPE